MSNIDVVELESDSPMEVATNFWITEFPTGMAFPGLLHFRGGFWEWHGGEWKSKGDKYVADALWKYMSRCRIEKYDGRAGGAVSKPILTDRKSVGDAIRALEAACRSDTIDSPVIDLGKLHGLEWDRPEDTSRIISFKDVLYDAKTGKTYERTPLWFDPATLTVNCDPLAECPRWEQALDEWSGGDKVWEELLERWFGYCLMHHREYRRWMLMHGKSGAGKSLIINLFSKLMPTEAIGVSSLQLLANNHGLAGMEASRVLVIPEAAALSGASKSYATHMLKSIIGNDKIRINPKFRSMESMKLGASVVVIGNQIPTMSNENASMSVKMLLLPFDHSFDGLGNRSTDYDLENKLEKELTGIAYRLAMAAQRLEAEDDPNLKFVQPERSIQHAKSFAIQNNPLDHFLESCCTAKAEGAVTLEFLWKVYCNWCRDVGIRLEIPQHRFGSTVVNDSSWMLNRVRKETNGEKKQMLYGLVVKRKYEVWGAD
jgi:P4 family phage/plasmid primase-like protien